MANGGTLEGQQFWTPETLEVMGKVRTREWDRVLGFAMRWRLGFHGTFVAANQQPRLGFGHGGLGGSGAWAHPETGMSIAFVTNRLGTTTTPMADIRLARLGAVALECARAN